MSALIEQDRRGHPTPESGKMPRPTPRQRLFTWLTSKGEASTERMLRRHKQRLFAGISGTVVEIGPGTGVNLPYYPPGVHWIAIEPNPAMHPHLQERAKQSQVLSDIRLGTAEQMNLPANSADVVVSTLVLCSVANLEVVLAEIQRVLKPGGRFIFLEHVAAAAGSRQRRHQDLLTPVWRYCAGGCRPNRETTTALEEAGFAKLTYEAWLQDIPVTSPMIAGVAVKANPS